MRWNAKHPEMQSILDAVDVVCVACPDQGQWMALRGVMQTSDFDEYRTWHSVIFGYDAPDTMRQAKSEITRTASAMLIDR